jgi:hypothetical protein
VTGGWTDLAGLDTGGWTLFRVVSLIIAVRLYNRGVSKGGWTHIGLRMLDTVKNSFLEINLRASGWGVDTRVGHGGGAQTAEGDGQF